MNAQDALSRVVELLVQPNTENLDRAVPYLEFAATALKTQHAAGKTLPADQARQLDGLTRRVRLLHQQAGRIRLGAARIGVAESAGYTYGGQPDAPAHSPNVAITG
jgi:hypothetical protein